jgi:hypothetical protein
VTPLRSVGTLVVAVGESVWLIFGLRRGDS